MLQCCVQIGARVPGRNRLPSEDDPEPEPVEVQLSRASLGQTGQHITLSLKPGASQVRSCYIATCYPWIAHMLRSLAYQMFLCHLCVVTWRVFRLLQNVYANMAGNVLVHVSAPSLGLAAAQWAVVSWGESQVMRESITDAKYIYRCASPLYILKPGTCRHAPCCSATAHL